MIRPDWIDALLELSQEPENGVVGGKLRFPNGAIESCGVALDAERLADTPFRGYPGTHPGHVASLVVNRDFSAVTGACQMVRADVFTEVNGYDESFAVDFGDVDFCLRVREAGYRVVTCPRAELTHYEAASRAYRRVRRRRHLPRTVVEGHRALLEPARPVRAGLHAQLPDPIGAQAAYARAGNDRLSA